MNKQEFDKKLKSLGLSRQDFCDLTGLAYSSVSNWRDEVKPVPSWVSSWLENYAKARDLDKAVAIFETYVNKK